jgi:prevent-host-death family protein
MATVTVRELRNQGGDVLDRVVAGEHLTVTRDGKPVAVLVPITHRTLPLATLLERRRNMPSLDPMELRRDLDAIVDPSL